MSNSGYRNSLAKASAMVLAAMSTEDGRAVVGGGGGACKRVVRAGAGVIGKLPTALVRAGVDGIVAMMATDVAQ